MTMEHLVRLALAGAAVCLAGAATTPCQSPPSVGDQHTGKESVSISRNSSGVAYDRGVLTGVGGDYKVAFERGGALFTPALGDGVPVNQTLRLTFEAARRGDRAVRTGAAELELSGLGDRVVRYRHGDVVERFDVRPDALKQSFVFDRRPAGHGDLVVQLRLETNLEASPGDRLQRLPLMFDGWEAAHVGAVVGVDAAGRRAAGHMNYDGEHLELVLPHDFVATASYPLTLDPPVCCGTQLFASGQQNHRADIAYEPGSDRYLAVWERVYSATDQDILGHLLSRDNVLQGGLLAIDTSSERETRPTVCAVAATGRFVVAWVDLNNPIPNTFFTSDIRGRTVDPANGALGADTLLVGLFGNAQNPCLGGDLSGNDDDCILVFESDTSAAIASREFTAAANGSLTEITNRRRTVGSATLTAGVEADPVISRDAGAAGLFLIAWVRDDQETSLGARYLTENSSFASPEIGVTVGSRVRNLAVSGDGDEFVVAFERAEAAGSKQDIYGFMLEPTGSSSLPQITTQGTLAGEPGEDETDPSIQVSGGRLLLGLCTERPAPLGPDMEVRELTSCALSQAGPNYSIGSLNASSYNLESAIALRRVAGGGPIEGLQLFRQDLRQNGVLLGSDIRCSRTVMTFAAAAALPVTGCPAAPHAFGGPVMQLFGQRPRLGSPIYIHGQALAGTPLCTLLIGTPLPPVPLSVIGSNVPGSSACVLSIATLLVPPNNGPTSTFYTLNLPDNCALAGQEFDVQWLDFEGTGANFGSSASVRLFLGY